MRLSLHVFVGGQRLPHPAVFSGDLQSPAVARNKNRMEGMRIYRRPTYDTVVEQVQLEVTEFTEADKNSILLFERSTVVMSTERGAFPS